MTKRRAATYSGLKALFLLGGVAASAVGATMLTLRDARAEAQAVESTTAEPIVLQPLTFDAAALPPVPTARPYAPLARRETVPAAQPLAAEAAAPQGAAPPIPTVVVPQLAPPARPQAAAPQPMPAPPVTSSRSSGG